MRDLFVEGNVLSGKYRVERIIGQGGMGLVIAAMHLQLGQRVAIKFLLPEMQLQPDLSARFVREARAVAQLRSEHVVRVLDVGTMEGAPYIVMEFLRGTDLYELLQERGPLPVVQAVDFALQVCEALAEAHARGIVHRDLKTANLFLTQRSDGSPLIKLLDFGISKVPPVDGDGDESSTATNAVMGSPSYMSPEQLRSSKSVDARADIWSLGVVLMELLTAQYPYRADTVVDLMALILSQPPKRPREFRTSLPAELEAVVLRCLEKNPEQRPQNVALLAMALAPFASPEGVASVARASRILGLAPVASLSDGGAEASEAATSAQPEPTLAVGWHQSASPPRRIGPKAIMLGAAGAGTLLIAAAAVFAALTKTQSHSAASSVPQEARPEPDRGAAVAEPSAVGTAGELPALPQPSSAEPETQSDDETAVQGPKAEATTPRLAATELDAAPQVPASSGSGLKVRQKPRVPVSARPKPSSDDIFSKRKW